MVKTETIKKDEKDYYESIMEIITEAYNKFWVFRVRKCGRILKGTGRFNDIISRNEK
jgi:hypothetical protein